MDFIFDKRKEIRVNDDLIKQIDFLVDRNPGKYDDASHLLRCLIIAEYNRVIYKKTKVVKNE